MDLDPDLGRPNLPLEWRGHSGRPDVLPYGPIGRTDQRSLLEEVQSMTQALERPGERASIHEHWVRLFSGIPNPRSPLVRRGWIQILWSRQVVEPKVEKVYYTVSTILQVDLHL